MESKKDNRILKVIIGLLLIIIAIVAYYAYNSNQENIKINTELQSEKSQIERELENISNEYTLEIEKGTVLNDELLEAQSRIKRLLDSVGNLKSSVALLSRYRLELQKIKDERNFLETRVALLEGENADLAMQRDTTAAALEEQLISNANISGEIQQLTSRVKSAGTLIPVNFAPVGVIIRNSGRQKENDRASRLDDIKVCFTVPVNPLAKTGVQTFHVQVINPDNNVLGLKKQIKYDLNTLTYSKVITLKYENKELDICELVNADEDDIISGDYRVNLYNGPLLVNTATIYLK